MSIYFYTTPNDITNILTYLEDKVLLKYVLCGRFFDPEPKEFLAAREIPNLGQAEKASSVACAKYLIYPRSTSIYPEISKANPPYIFGRNHLNYDCIVVTPGGIRSEKLVFPGSAGVGPGTSTPITDNLMKHLKNGFNKYTKTIDKFKVGYEAESLLKQGVRFTLAEQTPIAFDLKYPKSPE